MCHDDDGFGIDGNIVIPQAKPFDFLMNDHFERDVNFRDLEIEPYIFNFFFGIFCNLKPLVTHADPRLVQKFYVPEERRMIRWLLVLHDAGYRRLYFVNFYLNDTLSQMEKPISQHEYDLIVNGSYFKKSSIRSTSLHEYIVRPLVNASKTMKLVTIKLRQRALIFNNVSTSANGYRHMVINDSLFHPAWAFRHNPNENTARHFFDAADKVLRPFNQSLYNGKDSSAVFAFLHGILFSTKFFDCPIIIRHDKENSVDSFYLTSKTTKPFTLSFIGGAKNSKHITSISNHDLSCNGYNVMRVFDYGYGKQLLKVCNLKERNIFYKNGNDYLTNLFQYSKTFVKKISMMNKFVEYLDHVIEQVRPSGIRYSKSTNNYLKFFIMGTFVSCEENGYEGKVHTWENVFIFKPREIDNPFIIVTFNMDYRRISLHDLHDRSFDFQEPIILLSINETFSTSDTLLSKKFVQRAITIKLIEKDQMTKSRKIFPQWKKLERSTFLGDLLKSKQDMNTFVDMMEDMFEILYDINYKYSFHPFMRGLFYRSAMSKLIREEELEFTKYLSRWTYTVAVYDQENGWRNMYFYFLPSIEEVTQFVNSFKEQPMTGTNLFHIFLVYHQIKSELQTLVFQAIHNPILSPVPEMLENLVNMVFTSYSYYGATLCKPSEEYPHAHFGTGKYRLQTLRNFFSLPNFVGRHMQLINGLTGGKGQTNAEEKVTTFNQSKRWNFRREKKIRPLKKIHDQYLLGKNLQKIYLYRLSNISVPNILAIMTGQSEGLTRFSATGLIDMPKLIDVVKQYSVYLSKLGTPGLDAFLTALTSKSNNYEATDILQPLNELIELTGWEQAVQGLSIKVLDQQPASQYDDLLGLDKYAWKFPISIQSLFGYYGCTEKAQCSNSIIEIPKSPVQQLDQRINKFPYPSKGIHIICRDGCQLPESAVVEKGLRTINSTSSFYHCKSVLALHSVEKVDAQLVPKSYDIWLYKTGPMASAKALNGFSNNFAIFHGFFIMEGGDADDIFDFVFSLHCGSISGGAGDDTVKLNVYNPSSYELLIRSNSIRFRPINGIQEANCVFLDSIERIIGQPNITETVFMNCAFNMISLNGGQVGHPDVINIPQYLNCPDVISIVVRGWTVVKNMAECGRFLYKVSSLAGSTAELYLQGIKNDIDHTVILEHASLVELASITYVNHTIKIFSQDGGCLLLDVAGSFDPINLIFKDGEQLTIRGETLVVELNDRNQNFTDLMEKYADMKVLDNISLSIESHRFGTRFQLAKNQIQYKNSSPRPFRSLRINLDGLSSSIECTCGETYAHIAPYYHPSLPYILPNPTNVTFVYKNVSCQSVHLVVDVDRLLDYWRNVIKYQVTISIVQIEDSGMFKIANGLIVNGTFYTVCVFYFDGFAEHGRFKNIQILLRTKLVVKIQNSKGENIDDFSGYFPSTENSDGSMPNNSSDINMLFKKMPRDFIPFHDNIARIKPSDVDFNEILSFPTTFLYSYDMVRVGDHKVITSIRSNTDPDIRELTRSFFTIVLEDFFIDQKMKSLILSFGNGVEIKAIDLAKVADTRHELFNYQMQQLERYYTRKESEPLHYIGDRFEHKWREIRFGGI